MGEHNSLCSRLKVFLPVGTMFKCICHSMNLCASEAAKTLPRHCEGLIRNVYSYFSHSAKRKNDFKEFQEFCHTKPHKLLHVSQTRLLSLHQAVARVVEQWRPLSLRGETCGSTEYQCFLKRPLCSLSLSFLRLYIAKIQQTDLDHTFYSIKT